METLVKEPKRSALDLYGGQEAVLERMTEAVREGLMKKVIKKPYKEKRDWIKYFARSGNLSEQEFEQQIYEILDRKRKINYTTFKGFQCLLKLSRLEDILGKPYFVTPEIIEYWLEQKHKNPMQIVVGGYLPQSPFAGEGGLRHYVKLRAIGELIRSCS